MKIKLLCLTALVLSACVDPNANKVVVEERKDLEAIQAFNSDNFETVRAGLTISYNGTWFKEPDIIKDKETGCQYFLFGMDQMSVRYNSSGQPRCPGSR